MEKLKHKLSLCLGEQRRGPRQIYLAVILLALSGQLAAQENTHTGASLINQLKSPNPVDRERAANELGRMGPEAKQAVPALIEVLKDNDAKVRGSAADALWRIGREAKQAIPALIVALKDQNEKVRSRASLALGRIGPEAKQAIPALIEALKDQSGDVRFGAAVALGSMGSEAKQAIPALIEALKDQSEDVRSSAADSFGGMTPWANQAIPALIAALKDEDANVRRSAAQVLGRFGLRAKQALPALIEAIKDHDKRVRKRAAFSLNSIATVLFDTRSTESLPQLKKAYAALRADPELKLYTTEIKRTIDYFESLWWVKLWDSVKRLVRGYPYITLTLAAYLVLQLVWLLFFWLRPLLLLKVIISLGQVGERFKIPWLNITISFRPLLVFPLFYYRSRLLDAWVQSNLLTARENFGNKQTVSQRKVYVAMPASINEKTCDSLSAASFQPILNKSKVTILVAGEGGAGKTSLACQMALWAMEDNPRDRLCKAHRMLPVLIESNLEAHSDGKNALVETALGQLGDLIGMTEPIPKEFFVRLLRKRRVLVILDSLSESDETTHKSVRPAQSDFPIAALVMTSRIDEDLGGATKTTVCPLRLKSNSLSTFLHEYLTQSGKRGLFEDDEFFDDCRRLSQIVGEREITVLIARLFADQMVATKEQTSDSELPRNLPDLMQGYVKNLNDKVRADKLDTGTVLRAAKIIAAKCLEKTYRPSTARIDEVIRALSTETDAKALLKYLEERIQIVQTTGAAGERIRFSLDPLAEYLTGLYLVENYAHQDQLWQGFIDAATVQPGEPEAIKGFLLAVRDCCVDRGDEYCVHERIKDELAQLAGLDSEAVNAAQFRQRIRRLIANLKLPDAVDRASAAEMLGRIGPEAKSALPALIAALVGDDDTLVCCQAADALMSIAFAAHQAIPPLTAALSDENPDLGSSAASALGKFGRKEGQVISLLVHALKDEEADVRRNAAQALRRIGPEAKEAIPALIEALKDKDECVRCSAAGSFREMRSDALEAMPALIDALKDENAGVRGRAAISLYWIGAEVRQTVPFLIEALNDKDDALRLSAVIALRKMGPEAREAFPALTEVLTEILNDADEDVRFFGARIIEQLKSIDAGYDDMSIWTPPAEMR